jgi:hypothetical protein
MKIFLIASEISERTKVPSFRLVRLNNKSSFIVDREEIISVGRALSGSLDVPIHSQQINFDCGVINGILSKSA